MLMRSLTSVHRRARTRMPYPDIGRSDGPEISPTEKPNSGFTPSSAVPLHPEPIGSRPRDALGRRDVTECEPIGAFVGPGVRRGSRTLATPIPAKALSPGYRSGRHGTHGDPAVHPPRSR